MMCLKSNNNCADLADIRKEVLWPSLQHHGMYPSASWNKQAITVDE